MSGRLGDIAVAMAEGVNLRLMASADLRTALEEDDGPGVLSRIWDAPPPPDALLPYVSVMVTEPRDIGPVGMTILYAEALVTVKAVGQVESYDALAPIARALHAALQGQLSIPLDGGGMVMTCRRVRALAYPEETDGIEYRHVGGTYEVTAQ